MAPMIAEIAAAFQVKNPHIETQIESKGSSHGITDTRSGACDVGMVSKSLTAEHLDLRSFSIAVDGVAVMVNPANTVMLTDDQVRKIFSGDIRDWAAVGGPSSPIEVVDKTEGPQREIFTAHYGITSMTASPYQKVEDKEVALELVATRRNAVGFIAVNTPNIQSVRLLPVNGVDPTAENIAAQKYPIVRPMILVTNGQPSPLEDQFVQFARSAEAQPIIKANGLVPTP